MSISEMGGDVQHNVTLTKEEKFKLREKSTKSQNLHQRCLKIGVHIVIFMKYIFLNSLYINYVFLAFNVIVDANV